MRSTPMHLAFCQHLPKLPIFSNCSFRLMGRQEGYKPLGMIAPP